MPNAANDSILSHNAVVDSETVARPQLALDRHAAEVAALAATLGRDEDEELLHLLGHLHDFGKQTPWFQQHVRGETVTPRELTYHALVGAVTTDYAVRKMGIFDHSDLLAAVLAVYRHHGRPSNITRFEEQFASPDSATDRYQRVERKLDAITETAPEVATTLFARADAGDRSWEDWRDGVKPRERFAELAQKANAIAQQDDAFYERVLDLWTTLTLADTVSATRTIGSDDLLPGDPLDSQRIEQFLDPSGKLDAIRDRARQLAVGRVEAFLDADTNVATLTIPTGFGKTFTGSQTGLKLSELKSTPNRPSRVVYALPYTSIIDQTADELGKVYSDADGRQLALDHYLHDGVPSGEAFEASSLPARERALLRDAWRQRMTITTFVQLFESLTGPNKSQGLKLSALRNAVIVLDEPQTLPPDWLNLVNRFVKALVERYDAHIISMTATQPRLFGAFPHTPDPFGLVTADDDGFDTSPLEFIERSPRVEYVVHSSAAWGDEGRGSLTVDEVAPRLARSVENGSTLSICNTIDSARDVTRAARGALDTPQLLNELYADVRAAHDGESEFDIEAVVKRVDPSEPILAHLTTRHRPSDRLALIKIIKGLFKQFGRIPLLLVSTQLVEAGVDISFDELFRDLAPMPSLVQAAGRCNRSFGSSTRNVTVWRLADERGRLPSEMVYAGHGAFGDPIEATCETLDGLSDADRRIGEREMISEGVDDYFEAFYGESRPDRTTWPSLVEEAKFDELSERHLIDQEESMDVLVPRTDTDHADLMNLVDNVGKPNANALAKLRDCTDITVSLAVYETDRSQRARAAIARAATAVGEETGLYVMPPDSDRYDTLFGLL